MPRKTLNFFVKRHIYPFDIMVSMGQSEEQLKKYLDKYKVQYEDNMKITGEGLFYMNEKNQSILRLPFIPQNAFQYGTLAHEIFHATTHILDVAGLKHGVDTTEEAYAYLNGYITFQILNRLWEPSVIKP